MARWFSPPVRLGIVLCAGCGIVLVVCVVLLDRSPGERAIWRPWLKSGRDEARALAQGHDDLEKGRHMRAIQAVARIPEGSPNEAEALTIRGLAFAALERVAPARQALERAWKIRPNPMAAKVLAAIYLSAYENERGLLMLQSASRLDPGDFQPWYAMGEAVHLRSHRYDEALAAFREALKRRPGQLESRIGLVSALVRSHHPEEAEPELNRLEQERPDDPKVVILAAVYALEMGREQDAEPHLERVLALDPDHREALILRARFRFRHGRPRQALEDAEHALVLEPNDVAALGLVASIQSALGLTGEAAWTVARRRAVEQATNRIETIVQEMEEHPEDPEPHCRLGRVALDAGMKPLALQSYQAALALDPACQPARRGLIELGVPPGALPGPGGTVRPDRSLGGSPARVP